MQGLRQIDSNRRRVLRREILDRDGWACKWCGGTEHLTLHHIIPVRRGGRNIRKNLVTLCRTCHDQLELLEQQRDQQFIEEIWAIDGEQFVKDYKAAQESLGQQVSSRDEQIITTLLGGRR